MGSAGFWEGSQGGYKEAVGISPELILFFVGVVKGNPAIGAGGGGGEKKHAPICVSSFMGSLAGLVFLSSKTCCVYSVYIDCPGVASLLRCTRSSCHRCMSSRLLQHT